MLESADSPAAEPFMPQSELSRLEEVIKHSISRFLCWAMGKFKVSAQEVSVLCYLGSIFSTDSMKRMYVLAKRLLNYSFFFFFFATMFYMPPRKFDDEQGL